MRWKRTDGESAEAVREQVFLSRCKSEPSIVESSNLLQAASMTGDCPWSVAKN